MIYHPVDFNAISILDRVTPGSFLIFLNMGRPDLTNNPSLILNIPCIPNRLVTYRWCIVQCNGLGLGESDFMEFQEFWSFSRSISIVYWIRRSIVEKYLSGLGFNLRYIQVKFGVRVSLRSHKNVLEWLISWSEQQFWTGISSSLIGWSAKTLLSVAQ